MTDNLTSVSRLRVKNSTRMSALILHAIETFPSAFSPSPFLLHSQGIVGAVKCLTMEGKLARRIGSAWHSKSGTKNFAKFLSIYPSLLPSSLTLSHSLISFLEISLRRLSAGKLVSSAGPASAALSPALTTEQWRGYRGEVRRMGVNKSQGEGKEQW